MKMPGFNRLVLIAPLLLFALLTPALTVEAATVSVDVIQQRSVYPAGASYPVQFAVRVEKSWYIHGTGSGEEGLFPTRLTFADSRGLKVTDIKFPPAEKRRFPYTKEHVEVYSGEFRISARVVIGRGAETGERSIKGALSFQACSDSSCLPPEKTTVTLTLEVGSPLTREKAGPPTVQGGEGRALAPDTRRPVDWAGAGFWLTLLGIFLGGLALNLTPCIYPLIPITVSYFGGRGEKSGGKTVVHGALYILGLALTNSILGVFASLSGAMLGSILQNPFVLIGVAVILIGLATSFFGLWELRIPSGLANVASKNFGGYFGTFFMGLTLGIVAAPCLGPFILGLLTYVGQKGDPFLGFLYFFVLSIGMGLPLALLAVFSGAIKKLPVSGQWMEWIRKVLGWVLVGMAGYLIQPLLPGPSERLTLFVIIAIAAGIHLGWLDRSGRDSPLFSAVRKMVGLILIAGAVAFFFFTPSHVDGVNWTPYTTGILARAARAKIPVMLDFYADWCGPCRAMEKKVFTSPRIKDLSKKFLTVRVDLTAKNPEHDLLVDRFHVRGVPTILFLDAQGKEHKGLRIESYTNEGEVLRRMRKAIRGDSTRSAVSH